MIFDLVVVLIVAAVLIVFSLVEPLHEYCKRTVDREAYEARENEKARRR